MKKNNSTQQHIDIWRCVGE